MADFLRRALEQKGLSAEAYRAETVVKSARRVNSIIQQLVDSTRFESGQVELRKELTDPPQLVFEIAERVGTGSERARIRVEAPEWVPLVTVDPDQIERAIVNLITNALKYSPPESPVLIQVAHRNSEAVVSVTDQGAGIPPEDVPRLFQRFTRVGTGERREGLGLGLYITRLIVEAHGGRVWVESEVGKRSTFHLALPLASE